MNTEELYELVMKAMGCALDQDALGATAALQAIGDTGDPYDMYRACCGWAEIGRAALSKFYGDQAPSADRPGMWGMQVLDSDNVSPEDLFANRFLIAYCNDDKEMAPTLFRAALESDWFPESVTALLSNVAGLTRLATSR